MHGFAPNQIADQVVEDDVIAAKSWYHAGNDQRHEVEELPKHYVSGNDREHDDRPQLGNGDEQFKFAVIAEQLCEAKVVTFTDPVDEPGQQRCQHGQQRGKYFGAEEFPQQFHPALLHERAISCIELAQFGDFFNHFGKLPRGPVEKLLKLHAFCNDEALYRPEVTWLRCGLDDLLKAIDAYPQANAQKENF